MKKARRKHSQILLVNSGVARRLAELAELRAGQDVLEIGPGRGALTAALLAADARVTAVEIDEKMCAVLRARFPGPLAAGNLRLHCADFLKTDPLLLVPPAAKVVANLPYHLSTPILIKLLGGAGHFQLLLLTVQREFARRLAAAPGDADYGAITVYRRCRAQAVLALKIGRRNFRPVPAVDSAAILLRPFAHPQLGPLDERFSSFVQLLFSQRRKKLKTALAILHKRAAVQKDFGALLAGLNIDPAARPDTLSEVDLWRIFKAGDGL